MVTQARQNQRDLISVRWAAMAPSFYNKCTPMGWKGNKMKKVIALMLILSMVFALVACSSEGEAEEEKVDRPDTLGNALLTDFEEQKKANPEITAQELADALITNEKILFAPATMPVEPGFLSGFSNEITGFREGVMFAPMIGSIAFVGYVFEVDGDVDAFMETLKTNADPRWNICVEAEETVVGNVDNTVFFVMCPTALEAE